MGEKINENQKILKLHVSARIRALIDNYEDVGSKIFYSNVALF